MALSPNNDNCELSLIDKLFKLNKPQLNIILLNWLRHNLSRWIIFPKPCAQLVCVYYHNLFITMNRTIAVNISPQSQDWYWPIEERDYWMVFNYTLNDGTPSRLLSSYNISRSTNDYTPETWVLSIGFGDIKKFVKTPQRKIHQLGPKHWRYWSYSKVVKKDSKNVFGVESYIMRFSYDLKLKYQSKTITFRGCYDLDYNNRIRFFWLKLYFYDEHFNGEFEMELNAGLKQLLDKYDKDDDSFANIRIIHLR